MPQTSVTSKGQVTIPKAVRQQLGIRKGSQISFGVIDNHIEMRVSNTPVKIKISFKSLISTASVPLLFPRIL